MVLRGWFPGSVHYSCSDGKYFAVIVPTVGRQDPTLMGYVNEVLKAVNQSAFVKAIVAQPTGVIPTNATGVMPADMTPVREFPPGTMADEAMTEMGYTIGEAN